VVARLVEVDSAGIALLSSRYQELDKAFVSYARKNAPKVGVEVDDFVQEMWLLMWRKGYCAVSEKGARVIEQTASYIAFWAYRRVYSEAYRERKKQLDTMTLESCEDVGLTPDYPSDHERETPTAVIGKKRKTAQFVYQQTLF
jgi:DNA-directed RNA polymerase specialized sigma24 family protein